MRSFPKCRLFLGIAVSLCLVPGYLNSAEISGLSDPVAIDRDQPAFTPFQPFEPADDPQEVDPLLLLQLRVAALEQTVEQLQALLEGVARVDDNIIFNGVNVQLVNGTGSTYDQINGLGNLIIGYNEDDLNSYGGYRTRTGSHNLVIGSNHIYSSSGGLVAGSYNRISGMGASITAGTSNEALGDFSSVSGGSSNLANGSESSVSGGYSNTADQFAASVSGGIENTAAGYASSVGGGRQREAPSYFNWAAGSLLEGQ